MRRSLVVSGIFLLLVVFVSGPASAQVRDPFAPVVTEGGVAPQPNAPGGVDPIPNGAPFDPDNGNDGLPNTGGNVMSWWVVAYGLLAAGATSLLVAWSRRPISLR
ncbi:MAG: hypothetical protein QOH26_566 [Actinomycetota bacterium]|nr:hypothetical protein [Actinomycetota bacterium]